MGAAPNRINSTPPSFFRDVDNEVLSNSNRPLSLIGGTTQSSFKPDHIFTVGNNNRASDRNKLDIKYER